MMNVIKDAMSIFIFTLISIIPTLHIYSIGHKFLAIVWLLLCVSVTMSLLINEVK